MDVFLRTLAITIEGLILLVVYYAVARGAKLVMFDLGLNDKYSRIINVALVLVGIIFAVFCIAHLTTFYPPV